MKSNILIYFPDLWFETLGLLLFGQISSPNERHLIVNVVYVFLSSDDR